MRRTAVCRLLGFCEPAADTHDACSCIIKHVIIIIIVVVVVVVVIITTFSIIVIIVVVVIINITIVLS